MPDAYLQCYIHLVWATYDRQPFLTTEVRAEVYACIQAECAKLKARVVAIGGTHDHMHLLLELPSTVSVGELVKQIKGSSSHLATHGVSGGHVFKWQGGYSAFTLSKGSLPKVMEYIARQEEHHACGTTFRGAEIPWDQRAPHPSDA